MKKIIFLLTLFSFYFSTAQNWTYYTIADGLIDAVIYTIEEDTAGNYWFGSWVSHSEEVYPFAKFDGTNWTQYSTGDGIAGNEVRSFIIDSNGNHWLATNAGVSKYDGTTWTTYTTDDGLIGNDVWSVMEDNDGAIWFGSSNSETQEIGVSKFDGTNWVSHLNVGRKDIIQDNNENIWVVGYSLVSKYDGTTWTNYDEDDGLVTDSNQVIFQDSNNDIWVGAHDYEGGLSKFDGENWSIYTEADGLASNIVRAITQDTDGILWFGTNAGISKFDGTTWTTIDDTNGLMGSRVRSVFEDSGGEMWIGTFEGVSRLDPDGIPTSIYTYIPDDVFEAMLIDLGYDDVIDDYVLTNRIMGKRQLSLSSGISNYQGIEDFKSLTNFFCDNCNLPNLDFLNQNLVLKELTINSNATLLPNLNQFPNLESFSSYNTQFTDLQNQIGNLKRLSLILNQLPELDISPYNNLIRFESLVNQITSIDVSQNTNLEILNLAINQISSIDISQNTNLIDLHISNNLFNNIDLSQNTNLQDLHISNNLFSNIDVSQNTNLRRIYCSSNQLTNLDLRNGTNTDIYSFDSTNNPNLTCIFVDDSEYSTENWLDVDPTSTFVETEAECDALNINDDMNLSGLAVYPNPANETLYISNEENTIVGIELFDYLGKSVLSIQTAKKINSVDISNLPNSIYLVRLRDIFGNITTRKILKK